MRILNGKEKTIKGEKHWKDDYNGNAFGSGCSPHILLAN
jgi:hypothetical protein